MSRATDLGICATLQLVGQLSRQNSILCSVYWLWLPLLLYLFDSAQYLLRSRGLSATQQCLIDAGWPLAILQSPRV